MGYFPALPGYKKLSNQTRELTAESYYNDTIMPITERALADIGQWNDDLLSRCEALKTLKVPIMDPAKAIQAMKFKKEHLLGKSDPYVKLTLQDDNLPAKKTTVKRSNLIPEWNEEFKFKDPEARVIKVGVFGWEQVAHYDINNDEEGEMEQLNKLMLFPEIVTMPSDTLEKTMNRMSKRQRSMKLRRRVCTAVTIVTLLVPMGLALAGAGPVGIAVGASVAAAINEVLQKVKKSLKKKELKLKEVVEMMQLIVREFNGVLRLTEEIKNKCLNFEKHIKAMEKEAPEMEKIDEIESNAKELKEKIKLYRNQLNKIIKN